VSSLPPRYVTDITGHRSVYPASTTYRTLPGVYPTGVPPSSFAETYPTSLLYLLSRCPLSSPALSP